MFPFPHLGPEGGGGGGGALFGCDNDDRHAENVADVPDPDDFIQQLLSVSQPMLLLLLMIRSNTRTRTPARTHAHTTNRHPNGTQTVLHKKKHLSDIHTHAVSMSYYIPGPGVT